MLKGFSHLSNRCHFLMVVKMADRDTLNLDDIFITVSSLPSSKLLGCALRVMILGHWLEKL